MDGQNLSDPAAAFAGTGIWRRRSTASHGAASAIYRRRAPRRTAPARRNTARFPMRGTAAAPPTTIWRFWCRTVKPRDRSRCSTRGAIARRPPSSVRRWADWSASARSSAIRRVFGRAGVLSPSIWFGQGAILDFISEARAPQASTWTSARPKVPAHFATCGGGRLLVGKRVSAPARPRSRERPQRICGTPRRVGGDASLCRGCRGAPTEAAWASRLEARRISARIERAMPRSCDRPP